MALLPYNQPLYHILPFFSGSHHHQGEETLQAASRYLPTHKEDEGGRVIPSEGCGDSRAHQSFEEALFSWLQTFKDSNKMHPLTEERRQELNIFCSNIATYVNISI